MVGGRNSTEILHYEEVVIEGRNSIEILPLRKW